MLEVALAGNPNTGKTTLFNQLTGARAHVGNYPGITVERRHGRHLCSDRTAWQVHDLPGTYSLSAHSPEEEVAHHALTGRIPGLRVDVAVVVLDATNLSRNLLLLLQVAELAVPVVAALNMMDAAREAGLAVDAAGLAESLGCPVVPIVARTGEGLQELEAAVQAVAADRARGRVADTAWPAPVRAAIARAREVLTPTLAADGTTGAAPTPQPPADGEVLWWLATDARLADGLQAGVGSRLLRAVPRAEDPVHEIRRRIAEARFERIDRLLERHVVRDPAPRPRTWTDRIDAVVLHPLLGVGLFVAAMALLFQAIFAWTGPAMDVVDAAMSALGGVVRSALPAGLLADVLVDGVLAGVGATLIFLPQILMLFLGIAVLEDTGYLARAAFLVDRLMARVGLPGKAFVPLLSSFACNVPGIMAARTIGDSRDRLLTILVAPLMACSARLPVYTLVTAAVFAGAAPVLGVLSLGGLVVAAMYGLGFVLALGAAWLLRRSVVSGGGAPLLLEMPPYRLPRAANVVRTLWDRGRVFVVQTGSVIVALTVVLWALMTFPRQGLDEAERAARESAVVAATAEASPERAQGLAAIAHEDARVQVQNSLAGRLGHAIEPLIEPLGFDWRIGIGLIGSFAAREVLVPVMGQIYGRGGGDAGDEAYAGDVGQRMVGAGSLTPLKGISLMVFFAIAMQCMSTVAAIRRETNGWRWALFALGYLNGLAWLASFLVYQGGRLAGLS